MLEQITKKIQSKGWVPYNVEDADTIDIFAPRGPAEILEIGKQYLLLPRLPNPTDLQQVRNAMRYLTGMKTFPMLNYKGRLLLLATMRVQKKEILVSGLADELLLYQEFYEALDGLSQAPI